MEMKSTPIIDRNIFFGNPEISGGTLSPDGSQVAFLKAHNGIMNIFVKGFEQSFEESTALTHSKSPILGFFWTNDSKYILYINDTDGDENYHIFCVDPTADIPEGSEIPASRNLTPMEGVTAQIYKVSRQNPDVLYIGLNNRDKAWHDLYKLSISTGNLDLLFENNNRLTGWNFDWEEKPRLAYRSDESGYHQILRVIEPDSFEKIFETNLQESASVAGWNGDSSQFYLITNKGDKDLTSLYLMDPVSKNMAFIESDPEEKVDFGGLTIDRHTREIISTSYTLDKKKIYWKNEEWKSDYELLEKSFPGKEVYITSSTENYDRWLVGTGGDKYAGDVYFFDRESKKIIPQYTPRPDLKNIEEHLAPMESISYPSSDGLMIPAYLTTPLHSNRRNLPLVVYVHGGPKGPRDYWGYHPVVQFLVNRGYAVLQPNFRASGGYGKAFLNAGDKEWGKKMQDDITWGVYHLVELGIVDEARVAIMGGSYGGYATLAGLAFTPDLYACGVDIVGPSNLFTLLETIPPYWEAGRKWLYEMVGDPETEEGKKLLKEASPLFSADQINKPLLIIQGANDPRVKQAESDQIAHALHNKGKDVVYLNALDEGHGYRKPINRKALYASTEKFLSKHIGGRFQEETEDEVLAKIKEITVDPNDFNY